MRQEVYSCKTVSTPGGKFLDVTKNRIPSFWLSPSAGFSAREPKQGFEYFDITGIEACEGLR
jgi:hypothetical protein